MGSTFQCIGLVISLNNGGLGVRPDYGGGGTPIFDKTVLAISGNGLSNFFIHSNDRFTALIPYGIG